MPKTSLSSSGRAILLNGAPTYSDIDGTRPSAHGLLMNARFIQGIFDDRAAPRRFARFGALTWDPEKNTSDLIAALPQWYRYGLRAFTVGFQGGGPCFTTDNATIANNPFGESGRPLDQAYASRMDRLLRAADSTGMAVIVSFLYGAQCRFLADGRAVRSAVTTASRFLREGGYTNVIVEVANEHDVRWFRDLHPLVAEPEGMAMLIDLARTESGGLPVGCSAVGNTAYREVCDASDIVLIHGNGCTRQRLHNLIRKVQRWVPDRPIVCNEDSAAIGQLPVSFGTGVSWGYYNNATKQEPPAQWGILDGEDRFFAHRMAEGIGIAVPEIPDTQRYYFQGFEPKSGLGNRRWIRLASLYPELIDHVEFYRKGELYCVCYDEPFTVGFQSNWHYDGIDVEPGEKWRARVKLRDGSEVEKTATAS